MEELYALKLKALWKQFCSEHFSFWMICGYLFVEYVRPQSIIPAIDFLPWGQFFILGSLVGFFVEKNAKYVKNPANKWLIIYLAVAILSSVNAAFPQTSWAHLKDYYIWVIVYFLIINIVNSEARLFLFLLVFMLASFKLSLFGAKTWTLRGFAFTSWGLSGPPGFFQNSGELAIQMLMFSPVAYQWALVFKPFLTRLKFLAVLLLPITAAMTVIGASSRGAQIALVVQIYHVFLKGRLNVKTILLVAVIAGIGFAITPEEQKLRFTNMGEDRTSEQRLLYWKHGIDMVKENPVLGVGFYNFASYYEKNFPQDMLYSHAELPHNIFIQVGTDAGLLGLLVFFMLIFSSFRATKFARKKMAPTDRNAFLIATSKGLDTAMIGFLVAGQFVTVTYYPFMWVNLALSVALSNIALKRLNANSGSINKRHMVAQ